MTILYRQNVTVMTTKTIKELDELRQIMLGTAVNLVKLIDMYTMLKTRATNVPTNAIQAFREDAVGVVTAIAQERVNPDDDTFSENDDEQARTLLDVLGISSEKGS